MGPGLAIQQSCLSGLSGPGEISFTFHPVRIRYPNEITKAFHGAGRTGPVHLHYRASGINLFGL